MARSLFLKKFSRELVETKRLCSSGSRNRHNQTRKKVYMTTPIPAAGYPSNDSRTQSDMQTYLETMLSITKEQLGGTSEAASVELSSNTFTPGNNACVCVIDTSGMGATDTLNTIQTTNIRDGEVIFLRSTSSARVITVANAESGAGQIYTSDGNNIILNTTKLFVALKYNASITAFEEVFRTLSNPNWGAPGAIGATTPSTGAFTSLSLTGSVAGHSFLGNNTGASAAPSFSSIGVADLPSSVVASASGLSPLFSTSIASQALSFSAAEAPANSAFGNFTGSSAAPSFGTVNVGSGGTGATALAGTGALVMSADGTAATSVLPSSAGNLLTSNGTTWSSTPPSISLTSGVTGVLPIANGGTNASSLAANGVIVSNSEGSALSSVAPGATGNVLTSNGTSWASAAPTGGSSGFTVLDVISYTFCGGL